MTYLLHYAPDNASQIVRLVLEEANLPYRTALVDRAACAQQSTDYLQLNPNGLIPVLETPDGPIFETGAILLWLADRHGLMMPDVGSRARGDALKWLFFLSNTLHSELRMIFYPTLYVGADQDRIDAVWTAVSDRLTTHFGKFDILLQQRPGWLGAAAPSILDYYLASLTRWAQLYPRSRRGWFNLAALPNLHTLLARLETRPAVRAIIRAEGLNPTPFTAADDANPAEGSVF